MKIYFARVTGVAGLFNCIVKLVFVIKDTDGMFTVPRVKAENIIVINCDGFMKIRQK